MSHPFRDAIEAAERGIFHALAVPAHLLGPGDASSGQAILERHQHYLRKGPPRRKCCPTTYWDWHQDYCLAGRGQKRLARAALTPPQYRSKRQRRMLAARKRG